MFNRIVCVRLPLTLIVLFQFGCVSRQSPMAKPELADALVVTQLVKSSQSWDGEMLPDYPAGQAEITILRIRIPAGERLENHFHPVINAGVLISGQLTVMKADGKIMELKAGDPIVEVVNAVHYGINHGDSPAEIIVFYAGETGKPITVIEPR